MFDQVFKREHIFQKDHLQSFLCILPTNWWPQVSYAEQESRNEVPVYGVGGMECKSVFRGVGSRRQVALHSGLLS